MNNHYGKKVIIAVLAAVFASCVPATPTPTAPSTLPQPAVVGLWTEYALDGEEAQAWRLIDISLNGDGELEAIIVDLGPTTQVWTGLTDVSFREGILRCVFPVWGTSNRTFEGQMQADNATILELSEGEYRRRWERVEDAETAAFLQGLVASISQDHAAEYAYQPPDEGLDNWESAHLTDVGIDARLIDDLVKRILQGRYGSIHDILIVKDGRLVLEEYFRLNGSMYGPAVEQEYRVRAHILASSTKSVTSILVGLAIEQGFIESVDTPVYSLFPEHAALTDEQKMRILLKHFLTMTAGLQWNNSLDGDMMWSGQDIVELVLGKPVVAEPGERFEYSNGISTVLGAMIEKTSNMEMAEFSSRYLFAPLGIEDFYWHKYPDGTTDTDGNLALRPRDLARIGQLVLDDGRYDGVQIVSEAWIQESTERRVEYDNQWYGYQWWQTDFNVEDQTITAIHSSGFGGQYVFVFPELGLVFAVNGSNFEGYMEKSPFRMLETYILPAVLSAEDSG